MSNTAEGAVKSVIRFKSNGARIAFMLLGVVAAGLFGSIAATGDALFAVFLLLCPVAVLEGLRAEVVVDIERGTVSSQRAFRCWTGRIEDIENIRVPPWGPIALMLRPGVVKPGGGLWPGQVLTGVYADRRGSDGRAAQLAATLGLEVSSVWPMVRPGSRGHETDPVSGVRFEMFKSVSGAITWITVAICLSAIAVVVVATLTRS